MTVSHEFWIFRNLLNKYLRTPTQCHHLATPHNPIPNCTPLPASFGAVLFYSAKMTFLLFALHILFDFDVVYGHLIKNDKYVINFHHPQPRNTFRLRLNGRCHVYNVCYICYYIYIYIYIYMSKALRSQKPETPQ